MYNTKSNFDYLFLVMNYKTTECHTPEYNHCHENIKMHIPETNFETIYYKVSKHDIVLNNGVFKNNHNTTSLTMYKIHILIYICLR